jgi:hypothetical protein
MEHYQLTLTKQRLAKCGTFRADLIAEEVLPDPDESLPIHRRFFRPLLDIADNCIVYGLRRGPLCSIIAKRFSAQSVAGT